MVDKDHQTNPLHALWANSALDISSPATFGGSYPAAQLLLHALEAETCLHTHSNGQLSTHLISLPNGKRWPQCTLPREIPTMAHTDHSRGKDVRRSRGFASDPSCDPRRIETGRNGRGHAHSCTMLLKASGTVCVQRARPSRFGPDIGYLLPIRPPKSRVSQIRCRVVRLWSCQMLLEAPAQLILGAWRLIVVEGVMFKGL